MKTTIATSREHQDRVFVGLLKIRDTVRKDPRAVRVIDNHLNNRRYYYPQDVLAAHTGVLNCASLLYNNPVEAAQGAKKKKSKRRRNFAEDWAPAYEFFRRKANLELKNAATKISLPQVPLIRDQLHPFYEVPFSFFLLGHWLDIRELLDTGIPEEVLARAACLFAKVNKGIIVDRYFLFSEMLLKTIKKFIQKTRHPRAIGDVSRQFLIPEDLCVKLLQNLGYPVESQVLKMKTLNMSVSALKITLPNAKRNNQHSASSKSVTVSNSNEQQKNNGKHRGYGILGNILDTTVKKGREISLARTIPTVAEDTSLTLRLQAKNSQSAESANASTPNQLPDYQFQSYINKDKVTNSDAITSLLFDLNAGYTTGEIAKMLSKCWKEIDLRNVSREITSEGKELRKYVARQKEVFKNGKTGPGKKIVLTPEGRRWYEEKRLPTIKGLT